MLATTEKDSSVRTVDRKIFAGRNTVDFGIFANKAKHIIHRNFGNQGTHGNQIISCNVDKHLVTKIGRRKIGVTRQASVTSYDIKKVSLRYKWHKSLFVLR